MTKPYIIAEVGSNWRTFEDCKKSINLMKAAGADAIKFQMFTYKELYGMNGTHPFELPQHWIPLLAEKCKESEIDFMCTAFSERGYFFINEYVKAHKVASAEMTHREILEAVKLCGKPVYLSTGGSSYEEIHQVLEVLGPECPVTLMYCVSAYPAKSVDLSVIGELQEKFQVPVGYSDHTTDYTTVPEQAVDAWGATVLEKHVNPMEYEDTPDARVALNVAEFQAMVEYINSTKTSYVNRQENDFKVTAKRRLIAIKDIKRGDELKLNVNYGIYRSVGPDVKGLSGLAHHLAEGKPSKRNIKMGDPIGWMWG